VFVTHGEVDIYNFMNILSQRYSHCPLVRSQTYAVFGMFGSSFVGAEGGSGGVVYLPKGGSMPIYVDNVVYGRHWATDKSRGTACT